MPFSDPCMLKRATFTFNAELEAGSGSKSASDPARCVVTLLRSTRQREGEILAVQPVDEHVPPVSLYKLLISVQMLCFSLNVKTSDIQTVIATRNPGVVISKTAFRGKTQRCL